MEGESRVSTQLAPQAPRMQVGAESYFARVDLFAQHQGEAYPLPAAGPAIPAKVEESISAAVIALLLSFTALGDLGSKEDPHRPVRG
jgi:hypothetical protein